MSNLTIDVNVNPNGVASPTSTKTTESNETAQATSKTMNKAAVVAAVSQVAQRSLRMAASNVGELTGSRSLQRHIQTTSFVANLGVTAILNPMAAGVMAVSQLATSALQMVVENRNTDADIRYNQALRSATFNNSRR